MRYPSSQKLWRVSKEIDGYFYEIKLAGTVISRIKIPEDTLAVLKSSGIISDETEG